MLYTLVFIPNLSRNPRFYGVTEVSGRYSNIVGASLRDDNAKNFVLTMKIFVLGTLWFVCVIY